MSGIIYTGPLVSDINNMKGLCENKYESFLNTLWGSAFLFKETGANFLIDKKRLIGNMEYILLFLYHLFPVMDNKIKAWELLSIQARGIAKHLSSR